MAGPTSLSLRSLTKFYGRARGVEDISFEVRPGQVMGFLGPNGSGKTTVIRMLTGLIRITGGEAFLLGEPVRFSNPGARSAVGYLPGSLGLHENLTALQYFSFLSRVRHRGRSTGSAISRALEISAMLGLDPGIHIGSMSKGTRQKVGVVQAFMHRPSVLILDEPTSGLDPLVQRAFAELLEGARDEGAAVLLSSHVMHEVESIATHVTIILDGRQILVDEMAGLHRRVQRTLILEFDRPVSTANFERCPNVVSVGADDSLITCSVVGTETEVLRRAVELGVRTVTSSEPSLEDLFYSVTGAVDAQ